MVSFRGESKTKKEQIMEMPGSSNTGLF